MKDDLNASEKRLIAALDRINSFIDRTAESRGPAPAPAPSGDFSTDPEMADQLAESRAQLLRLTDELEALRASHSSSVAGYEARLDVANERLTETEESAVQLAAANEALMVANRALLDARPDIGDDQTRQALEAEIVALRAARSVEMSKLGEIADTLERMLGVPSGQVPAAEPARPAMVETPLSPLPDMAGAEDADLTEDERE